MESAKKVEPQEATSLVVDKQMRSVLIIDCTTPSFLSAPPHLTLANSKALVSGSGKPDRSARERCSAAQSMGKLACAGLGSSVTRSREPSPSRFPGSRRLLHADPGDDSSAGRGKTGPPI